MANTLAKTNAQKLADIIAEVNMRFKEGFDNQVEIAIQLAKARVLCKKESINFRDWVDEHIVVLNLGYVRALELARAGISENVEQTGKCLEDLRGGKKQRMQKTREKRKIETNMPRGILPAPKPSK